MADKLERKQEIIMLLGGLIEKTQNSIVGDYKQSEISVTTTANRIMHMSGIISLYMEELETLKK